MRKLTVVINCTGLFQVFYSKNYLVTDHLYVENKRKSKTVRVATIKRTKKVKKGKNSTRYGNKVQKNGEESESKNRGR